MQPFPIRTEHLVLREFAREDITNLHTLMSSDTVMRYLDLPHRNAEETREYLEALMRRRTEKPRMDWRVAVASPHSDALMGMISLHVESSPIKNGKARLTCMILPQHWKQRLGSEACRAMIEFGFRDLRLHKIASGSLKINTASEGTMRCCGMTKEAEFRKEVRHDGIWTSRLEYAILREEFDERGAFPY